ncbi:MAG: hypothetical protein GX653_10020 [Clostridiales bacterium]|nr:hypothetical protein [Clostridiales bacterium]
MTAWLLAVLMLLTTGAAANAQDEPRELVVANPTKLTGMFFTDRWGNTTSDVDVRTLLHGLNTVAHHGDGSLGINPTVVKHHHRVADAQGNVTYTLTLWDDLRFSDGSPITARDYAGSVLLLAGPQLRALSHSDSRSYEAILGYEAYAQGKSPALQGLRLLDEHALSLTIDAAFLPYYYELNLIDIVPYPMEVLLPGIQLTDDGQGLAFDGNVNQQALQDRLFGDNGYVSHPAVSAGPYRLLSYDAAAGEAAFERNPFYKGDHQGQRPSIERIRLTEARNDEMVDALLAGQVDLINKMTWHQAIVQVRRAAVQKKIQVQDYDRRGLAFVVFAGDEGPTASLSLRRAIASLVNRLRIVEQALRSNGKPVYGYYGLGQEMARGRERELQQLLDLYAYNANQAETAGGGWLGLRRKWPRDEHGPGRTALQIRGQ